MFVELVMFAIALPAAVQAGFLLFDRHKKKNLARNLVAIVHSLRRIQHNAQQLESKFSEVLASIDSGALEFPGEISKLFHLQRFELEVLGSRLADVMEEINIFGNELERHVDSLTGGKGSVLGHMVEALQESYGHQLALPKTFHINNLPYSHNRDDNWMWFNTEKDTDALALHIRFLLSQLAEINAVENLGKSADAVAAILREHFEIDDLL